MTELIDCLNAIFNASTPLKAAFTVMRQSVALRSDVLPYLIVNSIDDSDLTSTNTEDIQVHLVQLSAYAVGKAGAASKAKAVRKGFHRVVWTSDDELTKVHVRLLRPGKLIEEPEPDPEGEIVWHSMQEFEVRVISKKE